MTSLIVVLLLGAVVCAAYLGRATKSEHGGAAMFVGVALLYVALAVCVYTLLRGAP